MSAAVDLAELGFAGRSASFVAVQSQRRPHARCRRCGSVLAPSRRVGVHQVGGASFDVFACGCGCRRFLPQNGNGRALARPSEGNPRRHNRGDAKD